MKETGLCYCLRPLRWIVFTEREELSVCNDCYTGVLEGMTDEYFPQAIAIGCLTTGAALS